MKTMSEHESVLLQEALEALVVNKSGCYVDATFGRGGHSRKILDMLDENAHLVAIDKDVAAIERAEHDFCSDARFKIAHGSFADIKEHLSSFGMDKVDGVLADLGVSSPQLEDSTRGFSFMNDGPLDMRMDTTQGQTASEWIATNDEAEIARVLREYGEEKFSKRIARAIKEESDVKPFTTTLALAKVVSDANPSWEKHKHPATRVFQAIRIKINNELGDLEQLLENSAQSLKKGGRLVVISFHSLEDRSVKRFMRNKSRGNAPPPGVPVFEKDIIRKFKAFGKAIKPSDEEVERNIRSRSAVMRVLEKISDD